MLPAQHATDTHKTQACFPPSLPSENWVPKQGVEAFKWTKQSPPRMTNQTLLVAHRCGTSQVPINELTFNLEFNVGNWRP